MSDSDADDEISFGEDELVGICDSSNNQSKISKTQLNKTCIRMAKMRRAEKNLLTMSIDDKPKTYKRNPKLIWRYAFQKIRRMPDPWKTFNLAEIEEETVERYNFDSLACRWHDPVSCLVKMESTPFGHGSMRQCFKLKKMSSMLPNNTNWKHASNYVAKQYLQPVQDSVYFEDVKLQMDAKLWGQEYSRQNGVIKKVDICQMSVIRFVNRPGQPLFHLEHYIEGDYKKYNSNCGFVKEGSRNTPQAFSHFTFERSGHKLIVVDIQGVGDLYTDPQIHTVVKTDYGDGNLGPRGMALFFFSHRCNDICSQLGLARFDLTESETQRRSVNTSTAAGTQAAVRPGHGRSTHRLISVSEEQDDGTKLTRVLASMADQCGGVSAGSPPSRLSGPDDTGPESISSVYGDDEASDTRRQLSLDPSHTSSISSVAEHRGIFRRTRLISSEGANTEDLHELSRYFESRYQQSRPSCVDLNPPGLYEDVAIDQQTILGEVHHEMARLHSCGKLVLESHNDLNGDFIDWSSVLYHESLAADLGFLEAVLNLAHFHLGLDTDSIFSDCPISVEDREKGLRLMECGAESGNRRCMVFLGKHHSRDEDDADWREACRWLDAAIESKGQSDSSGCYDSLESVGDSSNYGIRARIAVMLTRGGHGLTADPIRASELYNDAAEEALLKGQGKLATRYFTLSESLAEE